MIVLLGRFPLLPVREVGSKMQRNEISVLYDQAWQSLHLYFRIENVPEMLILVSGCIIRTYLHAPTYSLFLFRNFRTSLTATRKRLYRRTWYGWLRRGWTACASTFTRRPVSIHSNARNSPIPQSWRRWKNANDCVSVCSAKTSSGICTTSYPKWPFRQWPPSSMEKSRTPDHR